MPTVIQFLLLGNRLGQSCISVQHIYVHQSILKSFTEQFVAATEKIVMGDPYDEKTFLGPIISLDEAKRLERWIQEAVSSGNVTSCYSVTLLQEQKFYLAARDKTRSSPLPF
jgi:acyl-CoA reductase-like NAD-dependent aldehyde dehydrogenase